jgi:hypothetical protein
MITIQYDPTTHVLVPREPNEEMIVSFVGAGSNSHFYWPRKNQDDRSYADMVADFLKAAPQAPAAPIDNLNADYTRGYMVGHAEGYMSCQRRTESQAPPAQPLPMTDEQIINTLQEIDNIARDYDGYEYGLPFHVDSVLSEMVASVRALFGQEAK